MKKKYLALMAGVAASMAIAAPVATAAVPELPAPPSLPAIPGAEANDGECAINGGSASASSIGATDLSQEVSAPADELNQANCQSFGNDRDNGQYSGQDLTPSPSGPDEGDDPQ